MVLNVDLNFPPVEGTSGPMNPQVAPAESSKGLFGSPIDVEAIDDYDDDELKLLPSSAAFPQGRNRARRNRRVTVDLEAPMEIPPAQTGTQMSNATCTNIGPHPRGNIGSGARARIGNPNTTALSSSYAGAHAGGSWISIAEPAAILLSLSGQNTTERASTTNRNNINNQQYVDVEEINNYKRKNTMPQAVEAPFPMPPPPPPPPKEPTFTCPLCFEPLKNPCSTFCGHIFCQSCIEACIASSVKERKGRLCPSCRSKLPPKKSFHRVYLPNAV